MDHKPQKYELKQDILFEPEIREHRLDGPGDDRQAKDLEKIKCHILQDENLMDNLKEGIFLRLILKSEDSRGRFCTTTYIEGFF